MGEAVPLGKLIEGLRQLPWLQSYRRKHSDYLPDCRTCKRTTSKHNRARWHCGYLNPDEWVEWTYGVLCPRAHVPDGPDPTICPGYTTQLPAVLEGARARLWREKGSLRDLFDDPITPLVRDAVDVFESEMNAVQIAETEKASGPG